MNIQRIGPSFGIRRKENIVEQDNYKVKTVEGSIHNKDLTIYSYYEDNILKNKLYHLQDKVGRCIKSKFYEFIEGKKIRKF